MKEFGLILVCLSLLTAGTLFGQDESSNELEAANPDIDFNDLTVGLTIELMAPEDITDDCDCSWGVSNELAGAFNPVDACDTQYIALTQGEGQIELSVQCPGEADQEFVQDFNAIRPVPQIDFTGSGCRLIRH